MPRFLLRHSALHPFFLTNCWTLCPLAVATLLRTCTKSTQRPPPGAIGQARAKVSWFRIPPDCLYLLILFSLLVFLWLLPQPDTPGGPRSQRWVTMCFHFHDFVSLPQPHGKWAAVQSHKAMRRLT